jgi:transcriptional regulator with XRE-family HTH domain
MGRSFHRPFPSIEKQMRALGLRLKVARLRRKISTILFAERMGVSRDTLNRLEKGDATIALGTYMRALRALGLDKDMDIVAQDDNLGRALQDQNLLVKNSRSRQLQAGGVGAADTKTGSAVSHHGQD